MKYTFQFEAGEKQVVETRSSESLRHILLKILGYILFYDQKPRIEIRVSPDKRDYKPDVVAFDAEGKVTLWVDCGQIAIKKVDDLTRQEPNAAIVIIKTTQREMELYARETARKVKRIGQVQFLGFDPEFIPALITQTGHLNTVRLQREGSRISLLYNAQEFTTTLWRWDAQTGRAIPAE